MIYELFLENKEKTVLRALIRYNSLWDQETLYIFWGGFALEGEVKLGR